MKRYFLLFLFAVESCLAAQFTEFTLGFNTFAAGINNNGVVVGYVQASQGANDTGFVRQANGTATTGYTYSGSLRTQFQDINDNGGIAGSYIPFACCTYALTYDGSSYSSYNQSGSGQTSWLGINNAGDMVGYTTPFGGQATGLYRLAGMPVTTFGFAGALQTFLGDINDAGQIGGSYQDSNGAWHAFIRNSDGSTQTIANPYANAVDLYILGINNSGSLSGYYTDAGGNWYGFAYVNGSWIDINYAGASRTLVNKINDHNQVVGTHNATAFGTTNAFIADLDAAGGNTGVPEPASYALIGTGLILLAGARRRFTV